MTPPTRLVLLHTLDPRGSKLGGIETHVRQILAHHPATMSVLFVGIDERGDLALGKSTVLDVAGRSVDFLPVAHVPASAINRAATSIGQSTTMRYGLGLLRHARAIRRAAGSGAISSEIERYEVAFLPKLLRFPFVVLAHNEGTGRDEMDSLLKKYWFLHLFNERVAFMLADRIFAVNPSIKTRIAGMSTRLDRKTEVLSVSVDTRCFLSSPFPDGDAFHVCYAGRLDAFKDPALMFKTLGLLSARLAAQPAGRFRRVVFDYVGASDPEAVAAYQAVAPIIIRHGICAAPAVAAIMRRAHAGIITSFFEGLPCYLLEMLASGRPVGALRLSQFAPLIVPGISGVLLDRQATPEDSANALAGAFVELATAIASGDVDPRTIAALARPYSIEAQMHRLFDCHLELALSHSPPSRPHGESISAT